MNARMVNITESLRPAGTLADGGGVEKDVGGTVVAGPVFDSRVRAVLVSVKTKAILATVDGSTPATATNTGLHLAASAQPFVWSRDLVAALKMVEAASSNAGRVRFEPLVE